MAKAVDSEDWSNVVKEKPSSPDRIILVEELRDEIDLVNSGDGVEEEDGTRAFGVLIQGRFKGRDRRKSACYLLKTSSVNGGMGPFCTHFCLKKVHSFTKSASSQFNDCWLFKASSLRLYLTCIRNTVEAAMCLQDQPRTSAKSCCDLSK